MTHVAALIREHTARIEASRAAYDRENHCRCGEFVVFEPRLADRIRTCARCKMRADIWKEVAT